MVPFQGALPSATRRGGGRRGKDAPEIRSSRGRHGRAGGAHPSGVAAREAAGPAASPAPHPYRGRSACRTRPLAARSGSKVTPWTLLTPPKYSFQLRWPRSAPFTNPLCMFLFLFKPRLPCDLFRKKKCVGVGVGAGGRSKGGGVATFFLFTRISTPDTPPSPAPPPPAPSCLASATGPGSVQGLGRRVPCRAARLPTPRARTPQGL